MKDYGVPEGPEGLLDWSWALERLDRCRNFWVVTASAGGRPHAMPVWGIWLPEVDEFIFSCAPGARKARNLRENPRITVAGDDSVEVVSIEGTAEEIDMAAIPDTVRRFAAKYEPDQEKQDQLAGFFSAGVGFRVTPERAFGLIETPEQFGPAATRWVW